MVAKWVSTYLDFLYYNHSFSSHVLAREGSPFANPLHREGVPPARAGATRHAKGTRHLVKTESHIAQASPSKRTHASGFGVSRCARTAGGMTEAVDWLVATRLI